MLTKNRVHPCKCSHCNKDITTSEWANKLRLGKWLCFECSRVKSLFNGFVTWFKGELK